MDRRAIYQKTEKGLQEIATRAHKLPARERSMLILVDGKNSGEQVIAQGKHFGDAEAFFAHLVEDGFIAPVGGAAATTQPSVQGATPTARQAPAPPTQPATELSAQQVFDRAALVPAIRRYAVTFFREQLGPDGDPFTVKIEKAATYGELMALLEKYRDVIKQLKGVARAEQFWTRVQGLASGEP